MRPITADAPVSDVRYQHRSYTSEKVQLVTSEFIFTAFCACEMLVSVCTDKTNSQCHLSVSQSVTVAEVIHRVLDANNIQDEQHLYSLIAVPAVGSELSAGIL